MKGFALFSPTVGCVQRSPLTLHEFFNEYRMQTYNQDYQYLIECKLMYYMVLKTIFRRMSYHRTS